MGSSSMGQARAASHPTQLVRVPFLILHMEVVQASLCNLSSTTQTKSLPRVAQNTPGRERYNDPDNFALSPRHSARTCLPCVRHRETISSTPAPLSVWAALPPPSAAALPAHHFYRWQ